MVTYLVMKSQNIGVWLTDYILTVNCRSIRDKSSEFKAVLDYIKSDIVCGTEALNRVKTHPRMPSLPAKYFQITIERIEMIEAPSGVESSCSHTKELISVEQPDHVTDCEVNRVKVQMSGHKDLYIGSFYMPHRKLEHIENFGIYHWINLLETNQNMSYHVVILTAQI